MPVTAGVILTGAFVMPHAETYEGYIDYMSRPEAVRNEKFHRFNAFNDTDGKNIIDGADETMFDDYADYLSNPLKTKSLFNRTYDRPPIEIVQYTKNYFIEGQENGSPLWQFVFSFRKDWLVENGLLNKQTNEVFEEKICDATREAMKVLIQKERLQSEWVGSIHFNTQHLHVHIGMVEKNPTREWIFYEDKENPENTGWQYKGKFKIRHIHAAKSKFVNHLLDMKKELTLVDYEMNYFIRVGKENLPALMENIFCEKLYLLQQKLPRNRCRWKYGYSTGLDFKKELDDLITVYLNNYMRKEFHQLLLNLKTISQAYEQAYGNPKNKATYLENKIYGKEGLYASLGNVILKYLNEQSNVESKSKPVGNLSLQSIQQLELEQRCVTGHLPPADELFNSDSDEGYDYYLENLSQFEPLEEQTNISIPNDLIENMDHLNLSVEKPTLSSATSFLNERLKELSKKQQPIEKRIAAFDKSVKEAKDKKLQRMKEKFQSNDDKLSAPQKSIKQNVQFERVRSDMHVSANSNKKKRIEKKIDHYEEGAKNISSFSKINQDEIRDQLPTATFVLGPNQWRLSGRDVKPSERKHPIQILAPLFSEENGNKEVIDFISIPMYDVSQTQEGKSNFVYNNQEGLNFLPNHYQPGVIWYGKKNDFDLEKLERQVRQAMKRLEYDRQHILNKRAYREMNYD